MQTITLKAESRTIGTKQDLKKIRRAGNVPCIIYGNGTQHLDIAIPLSDIKKITDTPKSYIIHIELNGEVHPCILHDAQYDPITDNAIHIDFLAISENKPVEIAVPVNVFGNAEGVKQGGRLRIGVRKVKICGPMDKLPDQIDVDITNLSVGKAIYAGELNVEGCKVASPKKLMVCEIKHTRAVAAATAAAATETAAAEKPAEEKK
ncbi:MAG: 50S ribosomal protein L25 [Bacteroidales bacterium]|nr:50S ribosomal protein L25 [Bacteroidales bacterium]